MSDEELLAHLRNSKGWPTLGKAAADRIEALTKERDEAKALQSCGCSYDTPTDVCLGHHRLFERLHAVQRGKLEAKLVTCEKYRDAYAECDRIGTQAVRDLEVKLEKAVEALKCWNSMMQNEAYDLGEMVCEFDLIARATLAEISSEAAPPYGLKGESHE